MALCGGCGTNVGCPCNLNQEGLCATCAYRKAMGLPFTKAARFVKNLLGW